MKKIVNGKLIDMTPEEIATFEAEQKAIPRENKTNEQILIEQKMVELEQSLHKFLDKQAKELGFIGDNNTRPYRAISNYVGYNNEYRADAEKLGVWFALCFKKAEEIKVEVSSGERGLPTVEELLSEMPQWTA